MDSRAEKITPKIALSSQEPKKAWPNSIFTTIRGKNESPTEHVRQDSQNDDTPKRTFTAKLRRKGAIQDFIKRNARWQAGFASHLKFPGNTVLLPGH